MKKKKKKDPIKKVGLTTGMLESKGGTFNKNPDYSKFIDQTEPNFSWNTTIRKLSQLNSERDDLGMPRISDQQYKKTLQDESIVDFTDITNLCSHLDNLVLIKDELLESLGFTKEYDSECENEDGWYYWVYEINGIELLLTNSSDELTKNEGYSVQLIEPFVTIAKTPKELLFFIETIKKHNKK